LIFVKEEEKLKMQPELNGAKTLNIAHYSSSTQEANIDSFVYFKPTLEMLQIFGKCASRDHDDCFCFRQQPPKPVCHEEEVGLTLDDYYWEMLDEIEQKSAQSDPNPMEAQQKDQQLTNEIISNSKKTECQPASKLHIQQEATSNVKTIAPDDEIESDEEFLANVRAFTPPKRRKLARFC
jgi:hypothetical protein